MAVRSVIIDPDLSWVLMCQHNEVLCRR